MTTNFSDCVLTFLYDDLLVIDSYKKEFESQDILVTSIFTK